MENSLKLIIFASIPSTGLILYFSSSTLAVREETLKDIYVSGGLTWWRNFALVAVRVPPCSQCFGMQTIEASGRADLARNDSVERRWVKGAFAATNQPAPAHPRPLPSANLGSPIPLHWALSDVTAPVQ